MTGQHLALAIAIEALDQIKTAEVEVICEDTGGLLICNMSDGEMIDVAAEALAAISTATGAVR